MVVVIGVDVHKDTHCAVAVDDVGRQQGPAKTVRATDAGGTALVRWAHTLTQDATTEPGAQEVIVAVEDCRHVSLRLERTLLAAGLAVVRVAPKLMAGVRTSARTPGKSDPIDALAIARVVLREGVATLPTARLDGTSRQVKLLIDRREQLVRMRTQEINRLRGHLHELDPALEAGFKDATSPAALNRLAATLTQLTNDVEAVEGVSALDALVVVELAGALVAHLQSLTASINTLEHRLAPLVANQAPQLLALQGCATLTAAKIIAETAGIDRFHSEAAYAMHAGTAPIPASSGRTTRYRLHRGGNRQLNAALHRIALTQIRLPGLGQAYYQRRRAGGDSAREALRALKRRLARVVYNLLTRGPQALPATPQQDQQQAA